MANYDGIRNGLATLLGAQTGLTAYPDAPGAVEPPCVVILPGRPAINYGVTMDGEVTVNVLAVVLLSAANNDMGQQNLDAYVSSSGAKSINHAVNADPTLGGTVEFAVVMTVQQYGIIEYAGQNYMGASFAIQGGAHL